MTDLSAYVIGVIVVASIVCVYWFGLIQPQLRIRKYKSNLKSENKYDYSTNCSNCNKSYRFAVPIGICQTDFLKDKKCSNCGCNIIKRYMPRPFASAEQSTTSVNHEEKP